MASLLPTYPIDLVHLPLRATKLSGHCAVAMLSHYDDLEFIVNVAFTGYNGDAGVDDIRMALKNLGNHVKLAHQEVPMKAWDGLPKHEIALVGLRSGGSTYWIVWNPYVKRAFLDPSLLSPVEKVPRYLIDNDLTPSLYFPVSFA